MFNELLQHLSNIKVFTESIQTVVDNFSINSVITYVMVIFTMIGAVDKIRGNKWGYGEKFDEGFHTMGPLAICMVGIISLTPILQLILQPIIGPIYELFGASPAMFAGTLLANDAGAYSMAIQMAGEDIAIANFSGLILGSMMGVTIVGIIPLALSIMEKEDLPYFSAGVSVGIVTIPIGCIMGGLMMNFTPYKISLGKIIINLIPVIIIAALIVIALWLKPEKVMRAFETFGRVLMAVITAGTAIAIFQFLTGLRLPLFNLMVEPASEGQLSPLIESLLIVGNISLFLTGAFPLVEWIIRTFNKILKSVGKKLDMNDSACAGLVATFASIIPTFSMIKDMNPKGKFLNIAFGISAAWVFGDHLGFTAGVNSDMIFPVIVGKLTAAIAALFIANRLSNIILARIIEAQSIDLPNEQVNDISNEIMNK